MQSSATASPGPDARLPSWHWQNPRPQGNNIIAVACVSATTCIAGAGPGVIRTIDGGVHWSAVSFPLAGGAMALACPSATVCYAAGPTDAARTTDAGQTWKPLTIGLGDDLLIALSCPTMTTCFAIGSLGSILATTDSGATWASRRNGAAYHTAYGISCPISQVCFLANANGLSKTVDGGLSWTVVLQHYTTDVTCPSATTCFAGGDPTFKTNDGGSTWVAEQALGASDRAIACLDELHCFQTGSTPTGDGLLLKTVDGSTWQNRVSVAYPVTLLGLACKVGRAFCMAGGSDGALLISSDSGGKWSELDTAITRENFEAVSCRDGLFCVAVGYIDADTLLIAITKDGGSRWAVPSIPGHESLTAVSCASTSVCVAVGLNATVATTHDGGATWAVKAIETGNILNMFVGVSCPSNAVCYAETQGGLIFKSIDGGMSWGSGTNLRMPLRGMDCPTPTVCYVVSPQSGQSAIAVTVDGGAHWAGSTQIGMILASVSCTGSDHCVAVGTCRSVRYCSGYQAIVTIDGGATWNANDATSNGPYFVSCGSTDFCVVVGAAGQGTIPGWIQVSYDGGFTWADEPIIDQNLLRGVSCNLGRCWAIGDGGAILAT